jgi:hypothetical protein
MSDRDYYEILGLTPAADGTMVDQTYWHLARKYQSLGTTNPRARDMLDELNEAYGVIGTPKLREQYDAFRDDVLITGGVIQPVKAHPKPDHREVRVQSERPSRRRLPSLLGRIPKEHWRTYGTGAVILALALAAAWQGVNVGFVIGALGCGLIFALTPTLRRRLPSVELGMPGLNLSELRLPQVSMPRAGDAHMARFRELGGGAKDEQADAGEIHASTAAMISRWRNSVGLRSMAPAAQGDAEPSMRLVDIVESEHDLGAPDEPLSAVIDILRGARRGVESE